jgi:hypothetical protein
MIEVWSDEGELVADKATAQQHLVDKANAQQKRAQRSHAS